MQSLSLSAVTRGIFHSFRFWSFCTIFRSFHCNIFQTVRPPVGEADPQFSPSEGHPHKKERLDLDAAERKEVEKDPGEEPVSPLMKEKDEISNQNTRWQ
jgi:hypothetical protein